MMKLSWLFVFLLTMSLACALEGFSISKDYTKNGFGVPGWIQVFIPRPDEIITAVPGPTLITQPSDRNVQGFVETAPTPLPAVQPRFRVIGSAACTNAPLHEINPFNRAPGFYIGEYGLSRQYIKSITRGE